MMTCCHDSDHPQATAQTSTPTGRLSGDSNARNSRIMQAHHILVHESGEEQGPSGELIQDSGCQINSFPSCTWQYCPENQSFICPLRGVPKRLSNPSHLMPGSNQIDNKAFDDVSHLGFSHLAPHTCSKSWENKPLYRAFWVTKAETEGKRKASLS